MRVLLAQNFSCDVGHYWLLEFDPTISLFEVVHHPGVFVDNPCMALTSYSTLLSPPAQHLASPFVFGDGGETSLDALFVLVSGSDFWGREILDDGDFVLLHFLGLLDGLLNFEGYDVGCDLVGLFHAGSADAWWTRSIATWSERGSEGDRSAGEESDDRDASHSV